jgi:hypothetical protein
MRKVRREVLKTINDLRARYDDRAPLHVDEFANNAAEEYAHMLLTEDPDEPKMHKICETHHVMEPNKTKAVFGYAYFEDDYESPDKSRFYENMDAHGLLLELTEERELLAHKDYTHLGIGFASDNIRVLIVEILSTKTFTIDRLQ